ncbi:8503_t:CDS:1, partial [Funneliformis mosseae]
DFFQAENANKSDHHSAEDMYVELNNIADKKEISAKFIPKIKLHIVILFDMQQL